MRAGLRRRRQRQALMHTPDSTAHTPDGQRRRLQWLDEEADRIWSEVWVPPIDHQDDVEPVEAHSVPWPTTPLGGDPLLHRQLRRWDHDVDDNQSQENLQEDDKPDSDSDFGVPHGTPTERTAGVFLSRMGDPMSFS